MYFALKTDCYYRKYGDIGYICRPIIGMEEVVDEYGAIFIERLQYSPKEIEDIVNELLELFEEVERYDLKEDALEFYKGLSKDGFLNEGEKLEDFKADGFDYATLKGRLAYKNIHSRNEQSSEIFLGEYAKENPFLQNFHI